MKKLTDSGTFNLIYYGSLLSAYTLAAKVKSDPKNAIAKNMLTTKRPNFTITFDYR